MRRKALEDAMRAQARGLEEKEKENDIRILTKKKKKNVIVLTNEKRRTIDGQKAIEGQWRPKD
jgi:CMP-2-keto-3-deoxyoctulosonic acid synthetase